MTRGYPSMTALLGLLAIAGYQNRDKLAEMLSGLGKGGSAAGSQRGIGGILSQITGSTGGASAGGFLSGGLSELRQQVPADEAGRAGDENRAYGPSSPTSLRMPLSSRARRCARIRFWTASFEMTVE